MRGRRGRCRGAGTLLWGGGSAVGRGALPLASPSTGAGVGGLQGCGTGCPGPARGAGSRQGPQPLTPRLPSPPGSSMYYDEDGDLAHEFYEETIVTKNGRKRAKLKRIHKNLIPQVRCGEGWGKGWGKAPR